MIRGDVETEKGDGIQIGIGNHDGCILAGTAKRPGRKGTGVIPPTPAQVYHGRGKDSTREFTNENGGCTNY